MEQTTARDMTFEVERGGEGPPVVLLHGFPETAASWRTVAGLLHDAGYSTYAPNQRGYSPEARPEGVEAYTMDTLADDVLALADAWGLDRFHLVGHDWGAAVAWKLTALHPERVETLTAVSVPHLAAYGWALAHDADQQRRASYIGLFRDGQRAEELLLEDDARRLIAMFEGRVPADLVGEHLAALREPGALTAALNWYRAMTPETDLPAVRVPTTYVWSTDDQALGRAGAERCGDHVDADYRFVELEGISHWIPEEAPGELAEAIVSRASGQ